MWDVTSADGIPSDVQPGTVDIVILVFVLSALHPDEWYSAIRNIHRVRPMTKERRNLVHFFLGAAHKAALCS